MARLEEEAGAYALPKNGPDRINRLHKIYQNLRDWPGTTLSYCPEVLDQLLLKNKAFELPEHWIWNTGQTTLLGSLLRGWFPQIKWQGAKSEDGSGGIWWLGEWGVEYSESTGLVGKPQKSRDKEQPRNKEPEGKEKRDMDQILLPQNVPNST